MSAPTGYRITKTVGFRWRFFDTALRKERLTSCYLTQEEAVVRYPGATPDLTTRQVVYVRVPKDQCTVERMSKR